MKALTKAEWKTAADALKRDLGRLHDDPDATKGETAEAIAAYRYLRRRERQASV